MPRYFAVKVTRIRYDEAIVRVEIKNPEDEKTVKTEAMDAAIEWLKGGGTKTWGDLKTNYESSSGDYCGDTREIDAGATVDVTV